MEMRPEICYRALASRDARFDGRFFTGVTSTGVYCRPICPAKTPKRENCRYFRCAAEAERAGFRPCRRCRPESSPWTPIWVGPPALVSRALRLIDEGALNEAGVEALAARVGVGGRYLRQLFRQHLGTSPLAVAQTRRLQFAVKLLDETDLAVTEIAGIAGFGSLRRFHAAFRAAYGASPVALRLSGGRANGRSPDLELSLSYRPPLNWTALIEFLARRAVPGVESVNRRAYRRTIEVGGQQGVIEVRPRPGASILALSVPANLAPGLGEIVRHARRVFDLDADPGPIDIQLSRDARLRSLVRARPGLRVPGAWNRFELAVRAILGQQVTVRGATRLARRLVEARGRRLERAAGELEWLFPRPEDLMGGDLAGIGVPRARATAIRALAEAVHGGKLRLDASCGAEEAVASMCGIPGIGEWTGQYVAMRALSEPDAFPASDLALRKALTNGGSMLSVREVAARAECWRPWRAYAALHLWMDAPGRKEGEEKWNRRSTR